MIFFKILSSPQLPFLPFCQVFSITNNLVDSIANDQIIQATNQPEAHFLALDQTGGWLMIFLDNMDSYISNSMDVLKAFTYNYSSYY